MLKVMLIIKTYLYLSIYITPPRLGKEPIEPRQRSQLDQRRELGIHQEQVDQLHFQKMKGQMPIHQFDLHKPGGLTRDGRPKDQEGRGRQEGYGYRRGLTPEEAEAEADPEADIDIEADRLADWDWEDEADAEEAEEEAVLLIS